MEETRVEHIDGSNGVAVDLADYCRSRAQSYAFFARLIDREVNAKSCELIRAFAQNLPNSADSEGPERDVIEGIRGMANDLYAFDEDVENDLACDYGRVFLAAGSYEDKCATPYESVYTSETGLLMQEARDEVRAIYRAAKVMPNTQETIPEDFAPFELDYMACLNSRIADTLEGKASFDVDKLAQDQLDFYRDHLANWMGEMLGDVDRVATSAFYHHFARALRGFLACEEQDLPALVDEIASTLAA